MSSCTECWLTVDGNIVCIRYQKSKQYIVQSTHTSSTFRVHIYVATSDSSILDLYHERFGHQNKHHVQMVIKRELNIDSKLDSEECVYGKVHRLQFGTRESATCPGELMSADVCSLFRCV